jgi:hypothetical protein
MFRWSALAERANATVRKGGIDEEVSTISFAMPSNTTIMGRYRFGAIPNM